MAVHKEQSRIEYIDLFRAVGIILMIMGHIKFGSIFDKWIHAFHMPMFFFVSGWFYKQKENVGHLIIRKIKTLLAPYIVFELVQWLGLMVVVLEYRNFRTFLYILFENTYKIPIENGTFGISPIPGAMWFLTAIFFIEVIYILLDKVLGLSWKLHVSIAGLVIIGMLAPTVLPFRLPWALDASFVGMGFFHVARIIKGTKAEKIFELKFWQALMIGVIISVSIMICPKINMRTGNYGWYVPFWINALGAIIAGWNLSRYVEKLFKHDGVLEKIGLWFKDIGKNSIVYLCLNQTVIVAVTKVLYLVGIKGFIAKAPILILAMTILFAFEKLIVGTRLKVIIGK